MILGVVGSRERNSPEDKEIVRKYILEMKPDELVSGGCKKGADRFCEEIAKELNIKMKIFLPQFPKNVDREYTSESKIQFTKAYYARNRQIAEYCDTLLALVRNDRRGGTENTIKHAEEFGKKIILNYPPGIKDELSKLRMW